MGIPKEREAFLQLDDIKEIFSQHDISWNEESKDFEFDFSVPLDQKYYFKGAWLVWQAAKAYAVPKLDKPAQVGAVRFQKGIEWKTVIECAQRHYEHMQEQETKRIAEAKANINQLKTGLNVTCTWSPDKNEEMWGNWHTSCGEIFTLSEGTPTEHKFGFCCFCGGKLIEAQEPSHDR